VSKTAGGKADVAGLDAEDEARANLYGLISRLFYAPADPHLMAEISAVAHDGEGRGSDGALATAWRELQQASRSADTGLVRQEYETLFVGVGRSEVTPYLSSYAKSSGPDRYLVRLRDQLGGWGLARREAVFELEDHISGVNDVLRWLIADGHPLGEQRRFFEDFAFAPASHFCAAVQKSPSASFYKAVANFAVAFYDIEKAAFEMTDAA
jgi:TorA maturation chaperone TorD